MKMTISDENSLRGTITASAAEAEDLANAMLDAVALCAEHKRTIRVYQRGKRSFAVIDSEDSDLDDFEVPITVLYDSE